MTSREKVRSIFNLEWEGPSAFWTGNPKAETMDLYLRQTGLADRERFFVHLDDDCRWVPADSAYRHPEGNPMFDQYGGRERAYLAKPGCFAECESLDEIERHAWPDPRYLDFTDLLETIDGLSHKAVFSGFWSPFFHIVADYFGMENYFIKMHTEPAIVEAVTEKVVGFLLTANDLFFEVAGRGVAGCVVDTFFFGNDFGTQLDLLISPADFERFVLPGFRKLIEVAKKHGKKVLLHSCGSIYKVIPLLIDAGIDALHPLQARAAGMDAEKLASEYGGTIAFVGGVDTQQLLVHAPPEEIKAEVRRLRAVLGPNFIVSPSHEAILPNVPLENVVAMAEAAKES